MKINFRLPLMKRVWLAFLRTVGILISLYMFVCSLTFLSSSFRILGGRNLSGFFSQSELLSNPVVGVMIGILVTVSSPFLKEPNSASFCLFSFFSHIDGH